MLPYSKNVLGGPQLDNEQCDCCSSDRVFSINVGGEVAHCLIKHVQVFLEEIAALLQSTELIAHHAHVNFLTFRVRFR